MADEVEDKNLDRQLSRVKRKEGEGGKGTNVGNVAWEKVWKPFSS